MAPGRRILRDTAIPSTVFASLRGLLCALITAGAEIGPLYKITTTLVLTIDGWLPALVIVNSVLHDTGHTRGVINVRRNQTVGGSRRDGTIFREGDGGRCYFLLLGLGNNCLGLGDLSGGSRLNRTILGGPDTVSTMCNFQEIGKLFWGSGTESGKNGLEGDRRERGNERASSVASAGNNRGVVN
jgi:hypothetical protein